ncbi:MAG: hypothetical protein FJ104_07035 [Deltaproteobacteria bacterium]|nr:hypothetical protein [Deltaproteobacteria bacterium]
MIHAGRQTSANPLASQAVSVGSSAGSSIRHNTIVLSERSGQSDGLTISASPGPAAVALENNLALGGDQSARTALRLNACPGAVLSVFAGNAFANLDGRMIQPFAPTSFNDCTELSSASSLETRQPALVTLCDGFSCEGSVSGNVHLRPVCSTATCARLGACFSRDECAASLFDGGTTAYDGVGALLGAAAGWRLRSELDCAANHSPFTALVGSDRYGASRTPPASRGAHEQDACNP